MRGNDLRQDATAADRRAEDDLPARGVGAQTIRVCPAVDAAPWRRLLLRVELAIVGTLVAASTAAGAWGIVRWLVAALT